MLKHGNHDDEKLAHARGQGHLGRFALGAQPLMERLDLRIAARGAYCFYVRHAPHLGTSAQIMR